MSAEHDLVLARFRAESSPADDPAQSIATTLARAMRCEAATDTQEPEPDPDAALLSVRTGGRRIAFGLSRTFARLCCRAVLGGPEREAAEGPPTSGEVQCARWLIEDALGGGDPVEWDDTPPPPPREAFLFGGARAWIAAEERREPGDRRQSGASLPVTLVFRPRPMSLAALRDLKNGDRLSLSDGGISLDAAGRSIHRARLSGPSAAHATIVGEPA